MNVIGKPIQYSGFLNASVESTLLGPRHVTDQVAAGKSYTVGIRSHKTQFAGNVEDYSVTLT